MSEEWWLPTISPTLSQGDVVIDLPLGVAVEPPTSLERAVLPGKRSGWYECTHWKADHNGSAWFLAKGKLMAGIVVSHGCDLDKTAGKARPLVLVAAVRSADSLSDQAKAAVFEQRERHTMPLPQISGLGDCYVDLRSINVLSREAVERGTRIASLTHQGRQRLRAQLVSFFTRIELGELSGFLSQNDPDSDV